MNLGRRAEDLSLGGRGGWGGAVGQLIFVSLRFLERGGGRPAERLQSSRGNMAFCACARGVGGSGSVV